MTTESSTSPLPHYMMDLLFRLAVRTIAGQDHLSYSDNKALLRVERHLANGYVVVIGIWNGQSGATFDRYVIRPGRDTLYTHTLDPNIGKGIDFLLRGRVENLSEPDRIAFTHDSFESAEAEAYWPTDMSGWPIDKRDEILEPYFSWLDI